MVRPSDRQLEILCLAARGLTKHEIAVELFLATKTVDRHYQIAAEKLESKNIVHSLMLCLQQGYVTMDVLTGELHIAAPAAVPLAAAA